MTTDAQRQANRANAQLSTGPKTAPGLERSSKNSLEHGGYASTPAPIPTGPLAEDDEQVAQLIDEVVRGLEPETVIERERAERIAVLFLRLRRISRLECAGLAEPDLDQWLRVVHTVTRAEATTARELTRSIADYREARARREQGLFTQVARMLLQPPAGSVDSAPPPIAPTVSRVDLPIITDLYDLGPAA